MVRSDVSLTQLNTRPESTITMDCAIWRSLDIQSGFNHEYKQNLTLAPSALGYVNPIKTITGRLICVYSILKGVIRRRT